MLAYKTFEIAPDFQDELNVVLKCPCGHIFSPGAHTSQIRGRLLEMASTEVAVNAA